MSKIKEFFIKLFGELVEAESSKYGIYETYELFGKTYRFKR